MMKSLILTITFFCIITVFYHGQATPTATAVARLHMLNQIQQQNESKEVGRCSYYAMIDTSCGSPINTTDQIGIKFGDANGNEVYVSRLDAVKGATFEHCGSTTFDITGPCTNGLCKVLLLREGSNGWLPSVVFVSDYKYDPIFFSFYNSHFTIYDSTYGYDYC